MLSLRLSPLALLNLAAFLVTAPHHISLYIASVRPGTPPPLLARPRVGVLWSFALAALWCWTFVLNVLLSRGLWRQILTGVFGGFEGLIIIGLAAQHLLDSFGESQIKL